MGSFRVDELSLFYDLLLDRASALRFAMDSRRREIGRVTPVPPVWEAKLFGNEFAYLE